MRHSEQPATFGGNERHAYRGVIERAAEAFGVVFERDAETFRLRFDFDGLIRGRAVREE